MSRREKHGSALSARHAFVVHLARGSSRARRRFSGRVEHLSSGQSARFSSLKDLLAFFTSVLDQTAAAASPAASDHRPSPGAPS
jgi:hypothetical protein